VVPTLAGRVKETTMDFVGHLKGTADRMEELEAQLADREAFITQLQDRGTKLIEDQRDLKRLVREVLDTLADPGGDPSYVEGAWVLKAQAMLERMK